MRKLLYRVASVALLAVSMTLCLVLVLPSFGTFQVMSVESESMMPTLSTQDVIVVTPCNPPEIEEGDIVTYSRRGTVITHRVTTNRPSLGELETKGDSNEHPDLEPVPYETVIGRMWLRIPGAREAFEILPTPVGRVYVFLGFVAAVLLWIRSSQLRRPDESRGKAHDDGSDTKAPVPSRPRHRLLLTTFKVLLAVTFIGSAVLIVRYRLTQKSSMDVIEDARRNRVSQPTQDSETIEPPIRIDFNALRATNPDVVGWVYCKDTQIDFPVLKGQDNDFYLRRNWKKDKDICGSIFVDSAASDGFSDARTVIYGHHMNDNLMFASLEEWRSQDFYNQHPVMWLLTPDCTYMVELIAGEYIPATSDAYDPATEHDEQFSSWLASYVNDSEFSSPTVANPESNYIMLSTCAYVYENARFTLLGKLSAI